MNQTIEDKEKKLEWLIYVSEALIKKIDDSAWSIKTEDEYLDFKNALSNIKKGLND